MDLGNSCLKRNGINLLSESIHPRHGLAWSDGRCIFLSPVKLYGAQVENESSFKLGEFQCIQSVHWGSTFEVRWCYLCVVHDQSVSIWKVEGELPKLSFKQVRKINASPISQGCLWNPKRDLLCLIGQQQCTFYYNHLAEKGSYAFPHLDRGQFACGAWNKDGTKLALAYETILLIYVWQDIDRLITQVQTDSWKVPGLDGRISAIVSLALDKFVLSAELPLEQLCRVDNSFTMPDLTTSNNGNNQSLTDDIIRPLSGHPASLTDHLLNLPRDTNAIQDSSQTLVVDISQRADVDRLVARGSVKELLSPDILMYDNLSQCIIVGSNAQCSLQIFKVIDRNIVKIGNIILDKEVRPKGLCPIPRLSQKYCTGCLVLLGRRADTDRTFLPSSQGIHYTLSLHFFALPDHDNARRRSLSRRRDASLQGHMMRHISPSPGTSKQRPNARSASFLKSDYKTTTIEPTRSAFTNKTQAILDAEHCNNNNNSSTCTMYSTKGQQEGQMGKSYDTKLIPKSRSVDSLQRGLDVDQISKSQSHDFSKVGRHNILRNKQIIKKTQLNKQPMRQNRLYKGELNRSLDSCVSDSGSSISDHDSQTGSSRGSTNRTLTNTDASSDTNTRYSLEDISEKQDEENAPLLTDVRRSSDEPRSANCQLSGDTVIHRQNKDRSHTVHAEKTGHDPVVPSRRRKQPIIELDSSGSSTDLEVVPVNFADAKPHFAKCEKSLIYDNVPLVNCKIVDKNDNELIVNYETGLSSADADRRRSHDGLSSSEQGVNISERDKVRQVGGDKVEEPTSTRTDVASDVTRDVTRSINSQEDCLANQQRQISDLKERIERLAKMVDDTACVCPTSYQDSQPPEVVHLEYTGPRGIPSQKTFLLDKCRLKLDIVQKAFALDSIELIFDGLPVVIGCNIDGYIPFKFTPSSTWKIRGSNSELSDTLQGHQASHLEVSEIPSNVSNVCQTQDDTREHDRSTNTDVNTSMSNTMDFQSPHDSAC